MNHVDYKLEKLRSRYLIRPESPVQVRFDLRNLHVLNLESADGELLLTIERAFTVCFRDRTFFLDPYDLKSIETLKDWSDDAAIKEIEARTEGTLEIRFTSGHEIVVRPSTQYETWSLRSPVWEGGSAWGGGLW